VFHRIAAESNSADQNPPEFLFSHNSTTGAYHPRAIYIDMEPRVLDRFLGCDENARRWSVSSQSGSGNNWARGYHEHGPQHIQEIEELIRSQIEKCDFCDGILFYGSACGGTGSGLGSRVLEMSRDRFDGIPLVPIYVVSSPNHGDVVTAPYNEIFTISTLSECAHVAIPLDNQALARLSDSPAKTSNVYSGINDSVASFISCLTSAMCFPDQADISYRLMDLKTNLVDSESRKFLVSSLATADTGRDLDSAGKQFDNMFSDLGRCHRNRLLSLNTVMKVEKHAKERMWGFGVVSRVKAGCFTTEDVIKRHHDLKRCLRIQELRYDLVSHTALRSKVSIASLIGLENVSAFAKYLRRLKVHVHRLFGRRSHLHHYNGWMDLSEIQLKLDAIEGIIDAYTFKI
jgi:tubulin epsilon